MQARNVLVVAAVALALLAAAGAVLYAVSSNKGEVDESAATIEDLCDVARNQRHTLELQWKNTVRYLASPAGDEQSGLNDFIRAISVPQLRARLKAEQVPENCRT